MHDGTLPSQEILSSEDCLLRRLRNSEFGRGCYWKVRSCQPAHVSSVIGSNLVPTSLDFQATWCFSPWKLPQRHRYVSDAILILELHDVFLSGDMSVHASFVVCNYVDRTSCHFGRRLTINSARQASFGGPEASLDVYGSA